MSVEEDAAFGALMDARLADVMTAAAVTGAAALHRNVSAGSRTGVHWPELPRQSSAPGEYPQEQYGNFKRGIGVITDGISAAVIVRDDPEKLIDLEFAPESWDGEPANPNTPPGLDPRDTGGRAPVYRTMTDQGTIREMEEAMEAA